MSNINELVQESVKKHSGYTNKNVKKGIGKLVGSVIGSPLPAGGNIATAYVGSKLAQDVVSKNNKKPMDEKSSFDRIGAITDKKFNRKTFKAGIKPAIVGGVAGAVGGAALGYSQAKKISDSAAVAAGGAGIGALAAGAGGTIVKGLRQGHKAAKKIGYGKVGRIAAAITPLTGLTTPKDQKDKDKKDKGKK